MKKALHCFGVWLKDEQGATAIEYALIAAFIVAVIVSTVVTLGKNVLALFTKAKAALN